MSEYEYDVDRMTEYDVNCQLLNIWVGKEPSCSNTEYYAIYLGDTPIASVDNHDCPSVRSIVDAKNILELRLAGALTKLMRD